MALPFDINDKATRKRHARNAPTPGGTRQTRASASVSKGIPQPGFVTIANGKVLSMLTDRHLKILSDRGLDAETLARFGVISATGHGSEDWIEIPYLVDGQAVNHKRRTIAGEKRFNQDKDARKVFWNQDVITDASLADEPLIITEGEMDALSAIQSGFIRTVSVPDGAPAEQVMKEDSLKYSYVEAALEDLRKCKVIILATDNDGPGTNLMNDLAIRIGRARCKWVSYPKGCKDLNDALRMYQEEGVKKSIQRAKWYELDGFARMSDLPAMEAPKQFPLRMPVMDEHYIPRLGDFTVVTGIPGHGKSSWLNEVACRQALNYGWVTAFASFEQTPQTDHRRNLRTYFNRKRVIYQSPEEISRADDWIEAHFRFLVPKDDVDVTLSWLLERCQAAVIRDGAKMIVIDPWNEMDHLRPPEMSLTEYVGFAIKQFKAFAKKYQVHFIVAAHPAKMLRDRQTNEYPVPSLYDISDSAHWINKPDLGMVIWRGTRNGRQVDLIRVAKARYHGQNGARGEIEVAFSTEDNHYTVVEGINEA